MTIRPQATPVPLRSSSAPQQFALAGLAEVGFGYVAAVVLSVLAAGAAVGAGADADGAVALLAGQAGLWTGFVVVVLVIVRVRIRSTVRALVSFAAPIRVLVGSVGMGAVLQVAVVPLLYLPILALFDDLDLDGPARDLLDRGSGVALVAIVLGVIVVAPIVEELFFRGLLLGVLVARWGPVAGLVWSSVIFGATHFQLLQFPGLALAGGLFAWLALRHGSLGPAVTAHAAFNATTVAVMVAT